MAEVSACRDRLGERLADTVAEAEMLDPVLAVPGSRNPFTVLGVQDAQPEHIEGRTRNSTTARPGSPVAAGTAWCWMLICSMP